MKNRFFIGVILLLFSSPLVFAGITYTSTDIGSDRWKYTYGITNDSLSVPIEEFTIWFDYSLYDNLAIETVNPPADNWDEIIWQPDTLWSIDGGYDALTLGSSIGIGETVSGFTVSFDWLGTGEPGSQLYEIINPSNWQTIESAYTVSSSVAIIPVPSALMLAVTGICLLKIKKGFRLLR